jgi:hypothetical protein
MNGFGWFATWKNTQGLLYSKSPMCTLSQNGYGARNVAVGLNSLGLPMKN